MFLYSAACSQSAREWSRPAPSPHVNQLTAHMSGEYVMSGMAQIDWYALSDMYTF